MHVSDRTFLHPRLYRVNALRDVHCWDGQDVLTTDFTPPYRVLPVLFFGIRQEEIEGCDSTPEQSRSSHIRTPLYLQRHCQNHKL